MVKMPRFLRRSAARDQDVDRSRFARLVRELDRLSREIAEESKGLRERFERACADAAFTMQAFEAEGDPPDQHKLEEHTSRVLHYPTRLAELEKQAHLLRKLLMAIPEGYLGGAAETADGEPGCARPRPVVGSHPLG